MLVCNTCGLTATETTETNEYLANYYCSNCGSILSKATEATKNVPCKNCGGETRPGQLYGENEITMIMVDRPEERFVHAYACTKCGTVQLVIDFETEVAEDE